MLASIRYRGPDGQGKAILPHLALGHVRLSIIDLEGGVQPLTSHDGLCLLSFNGEIFNYREFRATLEATGYPFRTHSDSEVILAVYQRYGSAGFSRLRGMFAFCLWDTQANCGYLVRDACGIKPLFLAGDTAGNLMFASEAKALLASGFITAQLEETSLHQVMNFRYLLGESTLFRGVRQVAPGDILQWTPTEGLRALGRLQAPDTRTEPLLDTLRHSVHAHLVADVEVGVHLSGGIDSAAILALAAERSALRTFTLDVGDDPLEAQYAAATAERFGVENIREQVNCDVSTVLPTLIRHMEMPKVNALQIFQLASVSARHVKVVLSGMGGDELFYGYNAYRILARVERVHDLLRFCRTSLAFNGFDRSLFARSYEWNEYDRMRAMLTYGNSWSFIYGLVRNVWDCPRHRAWIYGPRMLDSKAADSFDQLEAHWPGNTDPVAAARQFEWRQKLVNDLLWQEDRCTMAHSIESRVPFVDTVVAGQVGRMTRAELMPEGRLKARMKQELAALLPADVLTRRKSGFQVDSPSFYHKHLAALAQDYLAPDRVRTHGLFNPAFVTQLRSLPASKRYRWHYFMLYLMIGSHLWLEEFELNSGSSGRGT